MKKRITTIAIVGVAVAMAAFSNNANAYKVFDKTNPYTLTCTTGGGTAFSLDASAYSIQNPPLNIGSQGSGAGAGKITFVPATITVPSSEATSAVASYFVGGTFSSCSLIPTDASSTLPSLAYKSVVFSGYTFVAPQYDIYGLLTQAGQVIINLQYVTFTIPAS